MKRNRNYSSFESSTRRRRSSLPIVPIVLLILVAAFLWFIWSRGGEKPLTTVEKPVAAERLGK
jgi:multidrug resistance efflux pump